RVSDYLNLNNPSIVCHSAGFLVVTHAYVARHFKFNCLVTINSPARMEYLIRRFQEKIGFKDSLIPYLWNFVEKKLNTRNISEQLDTKRLAGIPNSKVLIVHDLKDNEVYFSESTVLKSIWPESRLLASDGLGHNRILKSPEIAQQIADYLVSNS